MKVTAQEEYGLRCIIQLARQYGDKPVLCRNIAEQEGISTDYVKKLLMCLRHGELVESVRGIKGGFVLTRSPDTITISQILQVLSAEARVVSSPEDHLCDRFSGHLETCTHLNACVVRPIWTLVSQYVAQLLDQITLEDLLRDETSVQQLCQEVSIIPSMAHMKV